MEPRWRALPAGSAKNGYCDVTLFLAKMAVLVVIENRSIKEGLMLLFLLFPFCLEGKFTGFLDNKSSLITRLSLKQLKSILQTERLLIFTYKLKSYVPVESKLQHPPPRATARAFELLKIGLFKFPSLEAKKPFKCPTNYFGNTSPQRQISSSIKHCSHFSERDEP